MRNEKFEKMMKVGLGFVWVLLKYLITLALVGLMAILYYQAGRSEMFDYPRNADEFCEQHEKGV